MENKVYCHMCDKYYYFREKNPYSKHGQIYII